MMKVAVLLAAFAFLLWTLDLSQVKTRIGAVNPVAFLVVFLLVIANFLTTSWRLTHIFRTVGYPLRFRTGLLANASGLVASLFVGNFIGPTLGRQYFLQMHGFTAAVTTLVVTYERALLAAVSVVLALLGALHVLGADVLSGFFDRQLFLIMGPAALTTLVVCLRLFDTSSDQHLRAGILNKGTGRHIFEASSITLMSSVFNLSTYSVLIFALGYNVEIAELFAAAAVVAFAASLPITFNGWGVREIAAIYVFGFIGLSEADALAVSITVGMINLLLILTLSPLTMVRASLAGPAAALAVSIPDREESIDVLKVMALVLAILACVLLFYQFPVVLNGTAITTNLADPVALLALSLVAAQTLFARSLPFGLSSGVKLWLVGLTLLLCTSLFLGWLHHGATTWAFGNRGTGWLVLMGYFSIGALMTGCFGKEGLHRLLAFLLVSAGIVFTAAMGHIFFYGIGATDLSPPANFQGFSGNRNAYAFQMLALAAVSAPWLTGSSSRWRSNLLIGVALLGALFSSSLTGLIAFAALLAVCASFGAGHLRSGFLAASIGALAAWLVLPFLYDLTVTSWYTWEVFSAGTDAGTGIRRNEISRPPLLNEHSLTERVDSWIWGVQMWLEHPIFGGGLGAFILSTTAGGTPLVIHSTYIWILAEMGLLGVAVVFSLPAIHTIGVLQSFRHGAHAVLGSLQRRQIALVLLLLVFALFSVTHDIAYQRLLWLLLGALLAVPGERRDTLSIRPTKD